ncbi:MAG: type IX secretion system sortase PorU [Sphingobacteriia bacterium]|nr:type IX secretion system sortase PorU [Sphingobacteriia bacterium]
MKYLIILLAFFLVFYRSSYASPQKQTVPFQIHWNQPVVLRTFGDEQTKYLNFDDATYHQSENLTPWFQRFFPLDTNPEEIVAELVNPVFVPMTHDELLWLNDIHLLAWNVKVNADLSKMQNKSLAVISFMPFRINPLSGKIEKLLSGEILLTLTGEMKSGTAVSNFAEQSVLASGTWFKIKIPQTGLFRVTYAQLAELGMNMNGLSSANLSIFGNGGGMLPESNAASRFDDLQETSIAVYDGGDGVFDPGDYFIFYGIGPDIWKLDQVHMRFYHQKHAYDNYSYYFITPDAGEGKRITTIPSSNEPPTHISATFNDYQFHELDQVNLIKSGREWFGEIFDLTTSYDFIFPFPNLTADASHHFKIRTVAKSELTSTFVATVNNLDPLIIPINGIPDNPEGQYAKDASGEMAFEATGDNINISLQYNKSANDAQGWLDYIELNVVRNNVFTAGQMAFRYLPSLGLYNVTEFRLNNANSTVTVWDVTDRHNVKRVETSLSGSTLTFTLPTEQLKEFIAFDGSVYYDVEVVGSVDNQNLHAFTDIEYMIVTHPDFINQALQLSDFHRSFSGLETRVVTVEQIYNEFSSGAQDITAIRNMMKMLYERGNSGVMPRYLLLFGDASYDYKNIMSNNSNFVPAFQSENSIHFTNSWATDDYFGYLDPNEGTGLNDLVDIGIGRLVVQTVDEAQMAIDKIIHYATSPEAFGSWRNAVTFVADDENGNSHLNQAEQLAVFIDTTYKNYNVDKIYIDAYLQESTTGGQRYPSVNQAINARIEKGTLIMNYTGHGGELGWAHERILEIPDINAWSNINKLPVFITATCEFSRYDDPERISAGEYVFLNPKGGGIALFTTARLTFGSSNLSLNRGIYKYAFERNINEPYSLGDLIRLAKMESSGAYNDKKFLLIGDPALKMAYSSYNIETLSINGQETNENSAPDTLIAFSIVTVSGRVTDEFKNPVSDFDGVLHATVFDKESEVNTLGQDDGSTPRRFMLRKNTLFNGKTRIVDGNFTFSFIVPQDIAYQYGFGKISYFANNETTAASGYYENIVIGGYDNTAQVDQTGPEIGLFMNDTTFISGGITNENPVLLAKVFDESGINTVGNSIGHDITAVLNDDVENPYILNDYYEADFSGYQNGTVRFQFSNLPDGFHEIKFKIWDVFNNSGDAVIRFKVINQNNILVSDLLNYPNPMTGETFFVFNHNKAEADLDVRVEIFDLSGRKVTELQQNYVNPAFRSVPLRWDGTTADGRLLDSGLYIYRLLIRDEEGRTASDVSKLIITR